LLRVFFQRYACRGERARIKNKALPSDEEHAGRFSV
jgi:hypothetical protein